MRSYFISLARNIKLDAVLHPKLNLQCVMENRVLTGEAPSSHAPIPTPRLVGGKDELKTQAAQREINQFSSEQHP